MLTTSQIPIVPVTGYTLFVYNDKTTDITAGNYKCVHEHVD